MAEEASDVACCPVLNWYMNRKLIRDEWDCPAVYMICEPASHYYRVMTRSTRMPVLIEERI